MSAPLIVISAGGTGGHVFPAEALAGALKAHRCRLALMTDKRGQSYGGALGDIETIRVNAGGLSGMGLAGKMRGTWSLVRGIIEATHHLQRLGPKAVVGFGGYPSIPAAVAAIRLRIPLVVHEQNAVLGRANRLLAARVAVLATSFDHVERVGPALAGRVRPTGMPVRPAVAAVRDEPYPPVERDGSVRVLVLGGSQGARIFSEIVPEAVALLPETLRRRLEIAQQCRPEDIDAAREPFAAHGIDATLRTFFEDVPQRLAAAHLVVCRSGASTVGELCVAGRPAILVPYPHATDDHQTANARALDEAGAGWLMPQNAFTAEALAARLETLLTAPQSLQKAAQRARGLGRPDAAEALAHAVLEVAETRDATEAVR